jgi:tetratricopeptide (TPR) repeat protein
MFTRVSAVSLIFVCGLAAQTPAGQDPAAALVTQGGQKLREGQHAEALALYRQALQASPNSFQAHNAAGVVLDLMGKYAEARQHFAKAIEAAANQETKARAMRSMAMSYAFEGDCKGAEKYEKPLHETYLAAKDFFMAGEIANELARVCLESGDPDAAHNWYRTGYEAGMREPELKEDRKDLWAFRWEHAQGRIAARRGRHTEAQKHVAAAKAVLDRGTNPAQAQFFPYLAGYVAFHAGDHKTALAELQKASQNDPFIQLLIAQTYEKMGDKAQSLEYYRKVTASTNHNPPAALSIPLARKKLS